MSKEPEHNEVVRLVEKIAERSVIAAVLFGTPILTTYVAMKGLASIVQRRPDKE